MVERELLKRQGSPTMRTDESLVCHSGCRGSGIRFADVRHDHGRHHGRKLGEDFGELRQPFEGLTAVDVSVGGDQHLRLDLAETVDNPRSTEVGGSRRENRPNRGRSKHGDHRFGHVRHPCRYPVTRQNAQLLQRRAEGRSFNTQFGPSHRPMKAILSPILDGGRVRGGPAAVEQVLDNAQPGVRKEHRIRHLGARNERGVSAIADHRCVVPDIGPESGWVGDRPTVQGVGVRQVETASLRHLAPE